MTGAEAGQPTQSDQPQAGHAQMAEAAATVPAPANGHEQQDYTQWAQAMQAYYKAQPQAGQPNAATAYYAHAMTQQPNPYAQMWAGQVGGEH